ncbi:hypothetical protein LTR66_012126 [Elasticomyces elasticus]|nr:hypothetical protein LTR66_012126 [Elasticomyces elasticus]KAK4985472.1 hypothetical protein LTR50_005957 [Elasticomyces elasticus]
MYLASSPDAESQKKLAQIKEKMGTLEKTLARGVARQSGMSTSLPSASADGTTGHGDESAEDDVSEPDDERDLEPTPLATMDQVYDEGVDNDDVVDLGIQVGKMRITERLGGWVRPRMVEELTDKIEQMRLGRELRSHGISHLSNDDRPISTPISSLPKQQFLEPGPDYIAPGSSFFFAGSTAGTSLHDYLPPRLAADKLIEQYFSAVHYINRLVHRPTFERQYDSFWHDTLYGIEPRKPFQSVVFAAMFSGAVSMSEDQVQLEFRTSHASLIDTLRSGTEVALSRANFLRTTKTETMQALVMYLIPLCRAEISRAHSALTGTAIRLAECIGLHRDGSHYGLSPVETHVRRLIWNQLCFLDHQTCEATGPRCQIRREDYDTKLPLNVDDVDLEDAIPPTKDADYWTDMTFSLMRFEIHEIRRQLWFDMTGIGKTKISLTTVLGKIQKFRAVFQKKYLPLIEEDNVLGKYSKHVYLMMASRCFVFVLHRYLHGTVKELPNRLRQIFIEAALAQLENGIILEVRPQFAPWKWYHGAYQQYHIAILLMMEAYARPMLKVAPRIWKCLDYIYDLPPNLPSAEKVELVIVQLRDRLEAYQNMRKTRALSSLDARARASKSPSNAPDPVTASTYTTNLGRVPVQLNNPTLDTADVTYGYNPAPNTVSGAMQAVPYTTTSFTMAPAAAYPHTTGTNINFETLPALSMPITMPTMSYFDQGGTGEKGFGLMFPPPPLAQMSSHMGPDSEGSETQFDSLQGSVNAPENVLAEIDWNEWDKYFPPDMNTGDIDLPDFNLQEQYSNTDWTMPAQNSVRSPWPPSIPQP